MRTTHTLRQPKVALGVGCALAFLATGCSASLETHTIDAAGNTTTHMAKTIGRDSTVKASPAALNLTGADSDATVVAAAEALPVEALPAESEATLPCLQEVKDFMTSDGAISAEELAEIPDAMLTQMAKQSAEEHHSTVDKFCELITTGVFETIRDSGPGESYATLDDFADAVDAAGVPCEAFKADEPNDYIVGGLCWDGVNPKTAWDIHYFDPTVRQELINVSMGDGEESHDALLVGPNWSLQTAKDSDLIALIPTLGGEFFPSS